MLKCNTEFANATLRTLTEMVKFGEIYAKTYLLYNKKCIFI